MVTNQTQHHFRTQRRFGTGIQRPDSAAASPFGLASSVSMRKPVGANTYAKCQSLYPETARESRRIAINYT